LILDKDILVKIGKFGNELIDDFELTFRIFRNKYKIAFAPLSRVYDEKPPHLDILFKQRSRWVRGHMNLLKHRIAEPRDIIGHLCWISPISIFSAFMLLAITSFALMHAIFFGYSPFTYAFIPLKFSLTLMVVVYLSYVAIILMGEHEFRSFKNILYAAMLIPFSYYWYVCFLKAFFVKSWGNTKTPHGFSTPNRVIEGKASIKQIDMGK